MLPAGTHLQPNCTFVEVGGDSLAAARLCTLLGEAGLPLAASDLLEYPLSHVSLLLDPRYRAAVPTASAIRSDQIDWAREWQLPADIAGMDRKFISFYARTFLTFTGACWLQILTPIIHSGSSNP